MSYQAGRTGVSRRQLEDGLGILRELRDLRSQVFPLAMLALQVLADDDPHLGLALASQAAHIAVSLDADEVKHFAFGALGLANLAVVVLAAARDLLLRSVRHFRDSTTVTLLCSSLEGLAVLAAAASQPDGAATLIGAAGRVGRPQWVVPPPKWIAAIDTVRTIARARLGPRETQRCLARGRTLPLHDALTLAETLHLHPGRALRHPEPGDVDVRPNDRRISGLGGWRGRPR